MKQLSLTSSRGLQVLLLLLVIALAGVVALMIRSDYTQGWRIHQEKFRKIIEAKFGPEKARQLPTGILQIWAPDLEVTDRCITCHQGVTWKGLEDEYIPYSGHSRPELIKKHPFEKFGCTCCHGGQGLQKVQRGAFC